MHPKKLRDICIDAIVRRTRDIKLSSKDEKEIYMGVKQEWDELWQLPENIPVYTGELLRAHLTHPSPKDFSVNLLIALAANLRRIRTLPDNNHLSSLHLSSLFEKCNVFSKDYQLQELDLTGVDMGSQNNVLIRLLPRCPALKVLKLYGNSSEDVLMAAKMCSFLVVLHITERQPWKSRMDIKNLTEIFFGVKDLDLFWALEKTVEGEIANLKPSWPNLVDLSTGYCAANLEFFILSLLTFKKLRYIASSIVNTHECLKRYSKLKRENPQLVRLSLGRFTYIPHGNTTAIDIFTSVLGDLQSLAIMMHTSADELMYNNLKKFADASLYPEELHVMNLRHICPGEPPQGFFSTVGKNVKELELHGGLVDAIDLKDIGEMLLEFPAVESLKLSIARGLTCNKVNPPRTHYFPKIKSLTIGEFVEHEHSYRYIFQMFPHIQEIVLYSTKIKIKKTIVNFKLLPGLRSVKISSLNWVDMSELLELPRVTQDGRRFELYAPVDSISEGDIKRIQNSGWNFFPQSGLSFKNII